MTSSKWSPVEPALFTISYLLYIVRLIRWLYACWALFTRRVLGRVWSTYFFFVLIASSARMDVEEAACLWLLYRCLTRRKQRQRRHRVYQILHDRLTHGMFTTLHPSLREHDNKSFQLFGNVNKIIRQLAVTNNGGHISSTDTMTGEHCHNVQVYPLL